MPRLIPNIQQPAEREIIFRELESRAAQGDQEAARFLQEHSGMRTITQRQVETGAPMKLGMVEGLIDPKKGAEHRLISGGLSVAGAPGGPLGSTAGAVVGTAIEQLMLTGKLDPMELGTEAGLNLVIDTTLPLIGRAGRGLIRRSDEVKKFIESVAKEKISQRGAMFFKDIDMARAGKAIQAVKQSGAGVGGDTVRGIFLGEKGLPSKTAKRLFDKIDTLAPYPDEDFKSIYQTANKLKSAVLAKEGASAAPVNFDIGELQNLRSKLQNAAFDAKPKSQKRLLFLKGKDLIDDAIDAALSSPPNESMKATYEAAKREYRLANVQQSLGRLIEDVTKAEKRDIRKVGFNMGRMADILRNPPPKYASVVRDIESVEGLKDAILDTMGRASAVQPSLVLEGFLSHPSEIPEALGRTAEKLPWGRQLFNAVGSLFAYARGREYIERVISETEGRLTPQAITLGVEMLRRQVYPRIEGQSETPVNQAYPGLGRIQP